LKTGLRTILFIATVTLVVSGCATDKGVTTPFICPFKENAIQLSLKADSLLNLYDNEPHTLDLCFYQLKNPNVFKLKSKYEDGLLELLECKLFDPTVTDFERITVQPGKDQTLIVDRADGSNYFGVVAGYFEMQIDRIARFQEIPVTTKTKIMTPWKKYQVCLDLNLEITLGPQQLERIEDVEK